jgi:iron complex outermembrane receptor protein
VLHEVGLRNTLEPDPDNTGVGSFRSRTALFLESQLNTLVSWSWKQGEFMFITAGADSAHIAFQPHTLRIPGPLPGRAAACRRARAFWAAGFLLCCLVALGATAQSPTPAQDGQAPPAETPKPAPTTQKIPRVITTVEVHAEVKNDYSTIGVDFGTLDGAFVLAKDIPLSLTVATKALLDDQMARVLSDAVKNDASIGEDYAPVGYYGDFSIRGFPIDLGSGIQINGMTVAGEQDVPLENKERVEFVKGIAGVESGVASAGGVINYVTKEQYWGEPRTLDLATDHRGSSYGAIDLNFPRRFMKDGLRISLAGENMHTYVESANGWRGMGAAEGIWQVNPVTMLWTDFEYQHKVQRSEAGFQLLGGSTVPARAFPSVMLGDQSWSKPNTFDVFNASSRMLHKINANWYARLAGSYSHSLIDDNVIWPYGAALDASGNSLCPNSPVYFFCPNGSYEIYDYRSPGELRINAVGEALMQGHFKTGKVAHDFVAGGTLFHRTVDLSPSIVYTALGVENIFQPNIAYAPESPYQHAGPSQLADFNHQTAALVQDRAHLPGGVVLQAGGRFVDVSDFNYATPRKIWLPQFAITYTPQKPAGPTHPLTFYANYGVLLSLGPQAPWWVDNSNQFLEPFFTRQSEIGVKYERIILLTAALFRMRQPFFYPKVIQAADSFCASGVNAGDLCFESEGHETHDGIELNAQGKAAKWMQLSGSITAMRATSSDTGTPAYDNKQVLNVPHLRTTFFADLALPHARGLHLMPGWSYTGRKEATRDDAVSVSGYNLFNLGARYTPGGEKGHITLRLYADNITDKRYWKDTGANYGDTFIHLGAPATVRLSAHYTF